MSYKIEQVEVVIKISIAAMIENIKHFKLEQLAGYYESVKLLAEVNKYNTTHVWNTNYIFYIHSLLI